jgi:excisionase family DNA binding protein
MPAVESLKLLTPKQVTEILGVDEQTLANWRCTGRHGLPFVRVGRSVRYCAKSLEQWVQSRTQGAAVPPNA